jgi:hypothetical protein
MTRLIAATGLAVLAGCSRPDKVQTFPSPLEGLFYTVEEYHAGGPVSDTDRVVAHLERGGKSGNSLVLDGGDMTVRAVRWNSQNDVTICIDGGITNTFRNQVTLFAGESSVTVRNRLDEHCADSGSAQAPSK